MEAKLRLRRMRWRGLAKAGVQIRLTAIAYNMKRSLTIIAMAGWRARPPLALTQERQKPRPTTLARIFSRPFALKPDKIKQNQRNARPAHTSRLSKSGLFG
ncbi:hypothetical protein [Rhizobium mongolense]|uniref:hypothetical protein n=1 Tax=Rhizobium mongolense TaxID=57676 RepID=UPI0034A27233